MKKLKKVLSLVLVLAMVFSFASTAFATNVEYTDYDAETAYSSAAYEAVEALSGAGILKGIGDDQFGNDVQFTREQAAMIIYRLRVGVDTANTVTKVDKAPFDDVAADRWSAAAIAYCADEKIIAGYGDGNFGPEDQLTKDAWLKMLLVSELGRDAKQDELLGDQWAVHAATLGINMGVVSAEDYKADFTREMAALYAYNALLIKDSMTLSNSFDVYGAPVSKVVSYKADPTGTKATDVASFPVAADATFNDVVGGKKVGEIDPNATLYVDGEPTACTPNTVVGGRGVAVSHYTLVNGTTRIVVINTYVGFATDIVKAGKNVEASYKVTAKGATYTFKGEATEGEVVVFTVGNKAPEAPYEATAYRKDCAPVLGTVSAVSGAYGRYSDGMYVGISGTKTFFNVNCIEPTKPAINAIVGVYYDDYGNILYLDLNPVLDPISAMQRIYILDASIYVEGSSTVDPDGDITKPVYTSDLRLQAHAIVWDDNAASVETINLAVAEENGKYYLVDKYGYVVRKFDSPDADGRPGSLPGTELLIKTLLDGINDLTGSVDISGITFPVVGKTITKTINEFAEAYVTADGEYVIDEVDGTDVVIGQDKSVTDLWGKKYSADDNIKATYLTYNEDSSEVTVEVTNGLQALKPVGEPQVGVQGVVAVSNKEKATEVVVLQKANPYSTLYGIYLGILEDNSTDGRVYAFGLSDGTIATLSYKGRELPDDFGFKFISLFVDTTDYAKIYDALEPEEDHFGTVYAITVNNMTGLIDEVKPMTATYSGLVEEVQNTRIFLGKNGVPNDTNYVEFSFARDFGKQGYKTEYDWSAENYTGAYAEYWNNDFVYLYTVPGMAPGSEEVVFITVGHKTDVRQYINAKGEVIEEIYAVDTDRVDAPVNGEVLDAKKIADADVVMRFDRTQKAIVTNYEYKDLALEAAAPIALDKLDTDDTIQGVYEDFGWCEYAKYYEVVDPEDNIVVETSAPKADHDKYVEVLAIANCKTPDCGKTSVLVYQMSPKA